MSKTVWHSREDLLRRAGMALESARRARDILGAIVITGDYPVFRHMVN